MPFKGQEHHNPGVITTCCKTTVDFRRRFEPRVGVHTWLLTWLLTCIRLPQMTETNTAMCRQAKTRPADFSSPPLRSIVRRIPRLLLFPAAFTLVSLHTPAIIDRRIARIGFCSHSTDYWKFHICGFQAYDVHISTLRKITKAKWPPCDVR